MKKVEIILSPLLLPLFDLNNKAVVVIDVLRATSTICAALSNGAKAVIPVVSTEEALSFKGEGFLIAGERNGEKVDGFDFGNSPLEYNRELVKDKTLVLTTTNGTKCIDKSSAAAEILVGSFGNISILSNYLKKQDNDILLFCSGWKDRVNLEDTLFAGALVKAMGNSVEYNCDSVEIALDLVNRAGDDVVSFVKKASHAKRFDRLGNYHDLKVCVAIDRFPCLVSLQNGQLIKKG
ncbi:MAG: 2-phosphosulfolactate phosphatase [Bacteroidia bacterium]|jgi:2-phosphosulfolactate phosphatase